MAAAEVTVRTTASVFRERTAAAALMARKTAAVSMACTIIAVLAGVKATAVFFGVWHPLLLRSRAEPQQCWWRVQLLLC